MSLAVLVAAPVAALVLALGAAAAVYVTLADELKAGLDRIQNLESRETFESTRIYDRNGVLLREVFAEDLGRRTYVPLHEIPETVRQATIAVEDKTYYTNPGIEPTGIVRATIGELKGEPNLGGGSTITQQFVRHVAFSYEERVARSYARKFKEIVLSVILSRQHSKDQVLEWYLNEIYYGNLAYGIEAASQTVFGKPASELDLAESALLAGLPQFPLLYDPLSPDPDTQAAVRERQALVLDMMVDNGFISRREAEQAKAQEFTYNDPDDDLFLAPHFVVYVEDVLEDMLGSERLARGGLEVTTSIDMSLQTMAERIVREHVEALSEKHHLTNSALVALEPRTGQVLAMVGSADYWNDEIDGRVNVALRERQPGSSIKPITYAAALSDTLPTSALLWDVPMEVWTEAGLYEPQNYDEEFTGPVRLRTALANSYNIPALRLMLRMGTFEDPLAGVQKTIDLAHRMGITGLTNPYDYYGIALTLGGGEVMLIDMATAFSTFANAGRLVSPHPVLEVRDSSGAVLYDLATDSEALEPEEVLDPRIAYIITDILSDNEARTPAFGPSSRLNIGVPAAAKTGTTTDFHDNWTVGYTPYLTTAVWAGNHDNSPMVDSSGLTGAGPIWNEFMRGVIEEPERMAIVERIRESLGLGVEEEFEKPEGVIRAAICDLASLNRIASGCPEVTTELFTEEMLGADVPPSVLQSTIADGEPDEDFVAPPGIAPDEWLLTTAAVVPMPPPPAEVVQAAEEAGEPVKWPPAYLCIPAGPGAGDEQAQPVAVLPLPPEKQDRFAVDGEARRLVLEWAAANGWAALEPVEVCTPAMAGAAVEPGAIPSGISAEWSGEWSSQLAGTIPLITGAEYHLNIAPGSTISRTTVLTGTVTYDPAAIEYFKVELGQGSEPSQWITIGTTHHGPIIDGPLETLDAPSLPPGEYIVRLVLVRKDGNFLNPPHSVPVRVGR